MIRCTDFSEPLRADPAERLGIDEIAITPARRRKIAAAVNRFPEK